MKTSIVRKCVLSFGTAMSLCLVIGPFSNLARADITVVTAAT